VLVGIGGIGKSRLLTEQRSRIPDTWATALLDLQVPAQRQPETALAVLRKQFGSCGVRFARFDIAYAVLWQRLHPHLQISAQSLALAENSEILTDVLDEVAGLPVFGTAAKLLEAGVRRAARWRWMRSDPTLQELDDLDLPALGDAVAFLLAEDLKAADRPYVLFVDAYEALVGGTARVGRVTAIDGWLRDVVAQLDSGLVVVASREPLGWERQNTAWADRLQTVRVDDLPDSARLELLSAAGVDDAEADRLAATSAGVPFYLHLALDARQFDPRPDTDPAVPVAILERFLQHVDPDQVRMLELLSVSRVIDSAVLDTVAAEFGLAGEPNRLARLREYSFVRPIGGSDRVQLHQLMVEALRPRLDQSSSVRLHRRLHELWANQGSVCQGDVRQVGRVEGIREALYHGVRAAALTPTEFLHNVDMIVSAGGKQALDQVLADLELYLAVSDESDTDRRRDVQRLVRYLRAEAAVLRGDGVLADELTTDVNIEFDDELGGRLAVLAGHARRIRGRTSESLRIYSEVFRRAEPGCANQDAGLWAADLHMVQGRFLDALDIATDLLEQEDGDDEFRGELARLRSLAYRFAFELGSAHRHLEEAEEYARRTAAPVLTANLAVNRVELLALTDPTAALQLGTAAVEMQRELGARHELGKVHTAIGTAHLLLGELDAADLALNDAAAVLDAVGYRSGRARVELFRALVKGRRGDGEQALASARWAVAELRDAEVYPGLLIAADIALGLFGWPDPEVTLAAIEASLTIQETDPNVPMVSRVQRTVARLAGLDPTQLLGHALRSPGSAGFYNTNASLESPFGWVNVRVPMAGADRMDLFTLPEPEVLRAVGLIPIRAPRLRWTHDDPPFQLHDHIEGSVLDDLAPRGTAVPDFVVPDVVELLAGLQAVPRSALPSIGRVEGGWPDDGDVESIGRRLQAVTERVVDIHTPEFGFLWAQLGFPVDPLGPLRDSWSGLTSRDFRLVHADVHRRNMIVSQCHVVVIDWELAMWGDPLYDVAEHVHKMSYLPSELSAFLASWERSDPAAAATPWRNDLQIYLRHERIKSALVDSVRYAKQVRSGALSPARVDDLVGKLTGKVAAAADAWGVVIDDDRSRVWRALTGNRE
jgi:aminoglycoside phosphotransferase (APT) family kinase protein